ncbi:DUF3618 domain-containing protein [Amaricoccus tamworthensis]|uniref:DUF3618 domain-containing protein n=1 Tax=Amaricoccus tamworthensis TaxID=57002 RepID=UPI003C7D4494
MTSETQTTGEIEREIERERAGLSHTLDELQDRFSVDSIAREIGDQFCIHGSDIGTAFRDSIKRNPLAVALTGAGIAWLAFGGDRNTGGYRSEPSYGPRPMPARDYPRQNVAAMETDRGDHGLVPTGAVDRRESESVPSWARTLDHRDRHGSDDSTGSSDEVGSGVAENIRAKADSVGDRMKSARDGVRESVSSASRSASDAATSASQSASDAAASARDRFNRTAETASERARRLRDRLSEGTESMSAEARERVIAARQRALEARDAAWESTRRGRESAADMFEENPLVAGALALAVGAAIGAALPRSRTEDRYMGEKSDELFREAERIYAEERDKVSAVAKAAADEAGTIVEDTKSEADTKLPDATDKAIGKVEESAKRVADAAKSEAKKQELVGSDS